MKKSKRKARRKDLKITTIQFQRIMLYINFFLAVLTSIAYVYLYFCTHISYEVPKVMTVSSYVSLNTGTPSFKVFKTIQIGRI